MVYQKSGMESTVMKTTLKLTILLSIFLALIPNCERKPEPDALLRIDSQYITIDKFYETIPKAKFHIFPEEVKKEKIMDFAKEQLLLYDAYKKGYHRKKEISEKVRNFRKNKLTEIYFNGTILDSVITEEYLLKQYGELLDARGENNVQPYYELREKLLSKAIDDSLQTLQRKSEEKIENLIQKYNVNINLDAVNKLASAYRVNRSKIINEKRQGVSPSVVLESINSNEVLISYNGKDYDKKWFTKQIKNHPASTQVNIGNSEELSNFILSIALNEIILMEAYKTGLDKNEEFLHSVENYQNRLILNNYERYEISEKIDRSENNLAKFFEKNKNELYLTLPTAEVQEIYLTDSILAERVLEFALSGENFDSLAERYTERFKDKNGYLGFISENMYGGIGRVALQLPEGTVYDKLIPSGMGFSIIRTLGKKEATFKPFNSVKNRVAIDYSNAMKRKLEADLYEDLKKKYKLKIYWKSLENKELVELE